MKQYCILNWKNKKRPLIAVCGDKEHCEFTALSVSLRLTKTEARVIMNGIKAWLEDKEKA